MSFRRILTVLTKEIQELLRDRKLVMIVLISPVVQLIIFGYAATYDVNNIPTALIDHDHSVASREIRSALQSSRYFDIKYYPESPGEMTELLERGDIWVGIEIPPGFAEDIAARQGAEIGVIIEATNSNSASITAAYLEGVLERFSRKSLLGFLKRNQTMTGLIPAQVESSLRIWYNPDLESRNFNVPAVVVQILVVMTLLLTSMSIVREREFGTMEQLVVTPIRSTELIIGKAIPYGLIGIIDVALILAVAVFYFQVPLVGSLALLFGTAIIFMISTMAIGLLISTFSTTQQQAMISAFFFMMPAILLSGFAFPIENMPESIQYLTYLNPLRYYVVIIRSIFLKGVGIGPLLSEIIPLTVCGFVALTLAALRFRKRIR